MNLYGAFLLFGPELEPCVIALTETQKARLDGQLAMASKHEKDSLRHDAYRMVFGVRAHWAVPCWSAHAMQAIATQYVGKDQDKVRGLAACIALGKPYGGPEAGAKPAGDDGGQLARIDPVKPKPRKPSGGNKVQPTDAKALMFGARDMRAKRKAMRIAAMEEQASEDRAEVAAATSEASDSWRLGRLINAAVCETKAQLERANLA